MSDAGRPVKLHRSGGGAPQTQATGPVCSPQVFAKSIANDCSGLHREAELFDEGYGAFCCTHQMQRTDCPYPSGTFEYTNWMRGGDYGVEEASG